MTETDSKRFPRSFELLLEWSRARGIISPKHEVKKATTENLGILVGESREKKPSPSKA